MTATVTRDISEMKQSSKAVREPPLHEAGSAIGNENQYQIFIRAKGGAVDEQGESVLENGMSAVW